MVRKTFCMVLYSDACCSIFFGDSCTAVNPDNIRGKTWQEAQNNEPFCQFKKTLGISSLVLEHQVHGTHGRMVNEEDGNTPFFIEEGDYLITATPGLGIGIATADCLPIVILSKQHQVVAVVHAGWRGLVGGIVQNAIDQLSRDYGVSFQELKLIVGPAAGVCCYQVGPDFVAAHKDRKDVLEAIIQKDGKFFFDKKLFLVTLCEGKGLSEQLLDFSYNECTICKPLYCSYRREKKSPLRQLTIVSLK